MQIRTQKYIPSRQRGVHLHPLNPPLSKWMGLTYKMVLAQVLNYQLTSNIDHCYIDYRPHT